MKKIAFLFFLLIAFNSVSQSEREWGLEFRPKIGFLAAHHGTMGHLAESHAFAGEISYFIHTKGKKQWHKACNYPTVGANLFGASVGNNKILGTYWGGYSFIEFPFSKYKFYEFSGKLGCGFSYGTKVYDPITNPKDVAMSTHINALICFGLKSSFSFNRNKITLGMDMTHCSNAATKVPNLGVNLPFISIGYARVIRKAQMDTMILPNIVPLRKWLFGLTAIGSVKETFPTGGKKYPVYGLNASFRWYTKPKVGFEASFDVISKQAIFNYKSQIEKTQWDIVQMGIFAGYLLPLDQFHLVLGMGVYVKDKYQPEDFLYHRIGMRYYFKNGMHAHFVLKSHWARADYIECGLGYTFKFVRK